jgi:hypothetical protein
MTTTYGEINWSDEVYNGDKKSNNKDLWLRLKEGSNEIRLLTKPHQYPIHRYKKDEHDKFGQKVPCSAVHGSCPLCSHPDKEIAKVRLRWLFGVINRETGTYHVLDTSWMVFSAIMKLARGRWGDPTKYDIDIVVDKNGGASGYYNVQPIEKIPLSAADQLIKDNADMDELKRLSTPPTPDKVQKRLDKINGVESSNGNGTVRSAVAASASASVVSLQDDEPLENSFPDYEEQASQ